MKVICTSKGNWDSRLVVGNHYEVTGHYRCGCGELEYKIDGLSGGCICSLQGCCPLPFAGFKASFFRIVDDFVEHIEESILQPEPATV